MKGTVLKVWIFLLVAALFVGGCASTVRLVQPGPWQVVLTERQADVLADLNAKDAPSALAISPSGSWGTAWGQRSEDAAREVALRNCRQHLREGWGDCLLYAVNGDRVAPDVVDVSTVNQRYRELDLASADAFFDRSDVSFASDGTEAFAQFARIRENSNALAAMQRNTDLEEQLTGSSLVERSGQVVWLGESEATIRTRAQSGILEEGFRNWRITDAGLLCLNFGQYVSTGRQIGMKCIVLRRIGNGEFEFQWAANGIQRRGIVVSGDARYTQFR